MADFKEGNLRANFIKLGFDKEKSQIVQFDINGIEKKLNQMSLIKSGSIPIQAMRLTDVKNETQSVILDLFKGVSLQVDTFEYELQSPLSPIIDKIVRIANVAKNEYKSGQKSLDDVSDDVLMFYKEKSKKTNIFNVPIIEKRRRRFNSWRIK